MKTRKILSKIDFSVTNTEDERLLQIMDELSKEASALEDHLPFEATYRFHDSKGMHDLYADHVDSCTYCQKLIDNFSPTEQKINAFINDVQNSQESKRGKRFRWDFFHPANITIPLVSGMAFGMALSVCVMLIGFYSLSQPDIFDIVLSNSGEGPVNKTTVSANTIGRSFVLKNDVTESGVQDQDSAIDAQDKEIAAVAQDKEPAKWKKITSTIKNSIAELKAQQTSNIIRQQFQRNPYKLIYLDNSDRNLDKFDAASIYFAHGQPSLAYKSIGEGLSFPESGLSTKLSYSIESAPDLGDNASENLAKATISLAELVKIESPTVDEKLQIIKFSAKLGNHNLALSTLRSYLIEIDADENLISQIDGISNLVHNN